MSWIERVMFTWIERVMFTVVLTLFLVITVVVIDTAYHHYQQEHAQETRQWPPAIPVCDKELWERVKGDCDE
jgi:hypothetical protein